MNPAEQYILNQREPFQTLLMYVRSVIKKTLPQIEEKYNYSVPFYHYNKRPMLYLNILKGTDFLDIAFVQGFLLQDNFAELKNYKNRKNVRSIQLKSLENFDELQFVALLKEAADLTKSTKSAWKP